MYLSFPGRDLQRLQGINITKQELVTTIGGLMYRWPAGKFGIRKFTIPDNTIQEQPDGVDNFLSQCGNDELFAQVAYYTLGVETVSANGLSKVFHIGWNRADGFMKELYRLHIVSAADGKLPRRVLPYRLEDVSEELLSRLECYGITRNKVQTAIDQRGCGHDGLGL